MMIWLYLTQIHSPQSSIWPLTPPPPVVRHADILGLASSRRRHLAPLYASGEIRCSRVCMESFYASGKLDVGVYAAILSYILLFRQVFEFLVTLKGISMHNARNIE